MWMLGYVGFFSYVRLFNKYLLRFVCLLGFVVGIEDGVVSNSFMFLRNLYFR